MNGQQRVLAAYDGSPAARRALARAADITAPRDTLSVINVMPEPGVSARLVPPAALLDQAVAVPSTHLTLPPISRVLFLVVFLFLKTNTPK